MKGNVVFVRASCKLSADNQFVSIRSIFRDDFGGLEARQIAGFQVAKWPPCRIQAAGEAGGGRPHPLVSAAPTTTGFFGGASSRSLVRTATKSEPGLGA